jgi:pimeloyl-ACP methyl ester carboxylesterase
MLGLVLLAAAIPGIGNEPVPVLGAERSPAPELGLHDCDLPGVTEPVQCGVLWLPEDRSISEGRRLPIKVVVIPARNKDSKEGPVFSFGGGPGQTATEDAPQYVNDWRRVDHDVVLVDHRGTGEGHRLDCPRAGSDEDLQGYLKPFFSAEMGRQCRESLERDFDLSQYTTFAAAQDLEDARKALGYETINVDTTSFGSYLALIYMREFPGRVRSAFLGSAVTLRTRVPLHMAEDTQQALDATFRDCEADKACHTAFPTARDDFYRTLLELRAKPGDGVVKNPKTGSSVRVKLTADAFTDAVRVILYRQAAARTLPFLVKRAREGDLSSFANVALQSNRRLYNSVRFGLFLSVTCNEFVSRIDPKEISAATEGTFIGDARVRGQMEACSEWRRSALPSDFFRDFVSNTPAVLSSYNLDPTINARWLEFAKTTLPNSVVITTAGGHSANNECTDRITKQLFKTASVDHLDLSCIPDVKQPPFQLHAETPNAPK